ncbi:hypothetical protein MUK42_20747 [Musa troglodytarum]|uniref:Uncharacterized protein n=1 Tax=Musa troglodytarum TaxID=320322 RepID=A0A9E7JMN6_9LILI|nr:hypothetical protein MUK42_20747 [Musa troglodytarum]
MILPPPRWLTGTAFYVTWMPADRWKTGRFDVAGHGRKILHVLVTAGATREDGLVALPFQTQRRYPFRDRPVSPSSPPLLDPISLTSLEPRSFNLPREICDAHQQPPEAPTRWDLAVAPRHGLEPSPEALVDAFGAEILGFPV